MSQYFIRHHLLAILVLITLPLVSACGAPSSGGFDLTGVWDGNDGGIYYLRQDNGYLWWVGMSRDDGLTFSNVFWGQISTGSIDGVWVDVPRSSTLSNGNLALTIDFGTSGIPVAIEKKTDTGGFGASTWIKEVGTIMRPLNPFTITQEFQRVLKRQDHALSSEESGLTPYKDNVVVFGKITTVYDLPVHIYYHSNDGLAYEPFICNSDTPDGDLNFDIEVDRGQLDNQPGFWTEMWADGVHPENIQIKLNHHNKMHVETIMFGKTAKCGDKGNYDSLPELPGWFQQGKYSVLLGGRPINGNVYFGRPIPNHTDNSMVDFVLGLKFFWVGQRVRVTGVLTIDHGHEDENDPNGDNVEIHPAYAIDALEPTPSNDLTGVWDDGNGHTYYLHQVGDQVFGLGMGPFRDRSFGRVFHGTVYQQQTISGEWDDVPLGTGHSSGHMSLIIDPHDLNKSTIYPTANQNGFTTRWTKLCLLSDFSCGHPHN